jgi:hypothetical protein
VPVKVGRNWPPVPKEVSGAPLEVNAAIANWSTLFGPGLFVPKPPTTMSPSGAIARNEAEEYTYALDPCSTLNCSTPPVPKVVSSEPSGSRRNRSMSWAPTVVEPVGTTSAATTMSPSGSIATAWPVLLISVTAGRTKVPSVPKVVSTVPSGLSRVTAA